MKSEEQTKKIQKIIAKAWADDSFKQRLLSNPSDTFREEGIEVPAEAEVRVVENTGSVFYFVLPPKPSDDMAISECELKQAVGIISSNSGKSI